MSWGSSPRRAAVSRRRDAGGVPAARRSRAAQESNPKATLAAHAEDLNLKTHERARGSAKDPLLHKMSQIFDSTSADSMLYNNLPMYNGMEITFDSGFRPCVDASVSGDAADNVLNDTWQPDTPKLGTQWSAEDDMSDQC